MCCEHSSKGYRNNTDDIPDIAIPASQLPTIEIKYKKVKESYDKLKSPKVSDKACDQKMKRKLETARTYLNTPYSSKSTRKASKFWNSATPPVIKRKRLLIRALLARLHSKYKEIMKLKEKLADLIDKYKKLQKENCLKLKSSY